MSRLSFLISISFAAAITGCGSMPTNPSEKAAYYAQKSKKSFDNGSNIYGIYYLNLAITLPTGSEKIKQIFAESPATKNSYLSSLHESISRISSPRQAVENQEDIARAVSAHILSEREEKELNSQLSTRITQGNADGSILFLIDPVVSKFPELADANQMRLIYNRTIASYKDGSSVRNMSELVKYAVRDGTKSADAKMLEQSLPSMRVMSRELDVIQPYFPDYATARRAQITAKVHLSVKNADRLFADDVKANLTKTIGGIVWVQNPGNDVVELIIERIKNDEHIAPESTQTVTYSYSDVNIISAALLMPKNASYLFDLTKGGASIDYGYIISVQRGNESRFETIERGKVEYSYNKCQNARIQNVFGGVSRAEFVANDQMQKECNNSQQSSIDDLRNQVIENIANKTLDIPSIKALHEANL